MKNIYIKYIACFVLLFAVTLNYASAQEKAPNFVNFSTPNEDRTYKTGETITLYADFDEWLGGGEMTATLNTGEQVTFTFDPQFADDLMDPNWGVPKTENMQNYDDNNRYGVYAIVELQNLARTNGHFIFAGGFNNYEKLGTKGLIYTDKNGQLLQDISQLIRTGTYADRDEIMGVAETADGGIIVQGHFYDVDGKNNYDHLLKFKFNEATRLFEIDHDFMKNLTQNNTVPAMNGTVASVTLFGKPNNTIILDGAGNIYVSGDFTKVGGYNRVCLAKIKPNGDVDTEFSGTSGGWLLIGNTGSAMALDPRIKTKYNLQDEHFWIGTHVDGTASNNAQNSNHSNNRKHYFSAAGAESGIAMINTRTGEVFDNNRTIGVAGSGWGPFTGSDGVIGVTPIPDDLEGSPGGVLITGQGNVWYGYMDLGTYNYRDDPNSGTYTGGGTFNDLRPSSGEDFWGWSYGGYSAVTLYDLDLNLVPTSKFKFMGEQRGNAISLGGWAIDGVAFLKGKMWIGTHDGGSNRATHDGSLVVLDMNGDVNKPFNNMLRRGTTLEGDVGGFSGGQQDVLSLEVTQDQKLLVGGNYQTFYENKFRADHLNTDDDNHLVKLQFTRAIATYTVKENDLQNELTIVSIDNSNMQNVFNPELNNGTAEMPSDPSLIFENNHTLSINKDYEGNIFIESQEYDYNDGYHLYNQEGMDRSKIPATYVRKTGGGFVINSATNPSLVNADFNGFIVSKETRISEITISDPTNIEFPNISGTYTFHSATNTWRLQVTGSEEGVIVEFPDSGIKLTSAASITIPATASRDLYLMATWVSTKNFYTIRYIDMDTNEDFGNLSLEEFFLYDRDNSQAMPLIRPYFVDKAFEGWYTKDENGNYSYIEEVPGNRKEAINLYGRFRTYQPDNCKYYTITYLDADGNELTADNLDIANWWGVKEEATVYMGSPDNQNPFALPNPLSTLNDETNGAYNGNAGAFTGWKIVKVGTTDVTDGATITSLPLDQTENIVVQLQLDYYSFIISFKDPLHEQVGTLSQNDIEVEYNDLPSVIFESIWYAGYDFSGWSESIAGTGTYSNNGVKPVVTPADLQDIAKSLSGTSTINLYAIWGDGGGETNGMKTFKINLYDKYKNVTLSPNNTYTKKYNELTASFTFPTLNPLDQFIHNGWSLYMNPGDFNGVAENKVTSGAELAAMIDSEQITEETINLYAVWGGDGVGEPDITDVYQIFYYKDAAKTDPYGQAYFNPAVKSYLMKVSEPGKLFEAWTLGVDTQDDAAFGSDANGQFVKAGAVEGELHVAATWYDFEGGADCEYYTITYLKQDGTTYTFSSSTGVIYYYQARKATNLPTPNVGTGTGWSLTKGGNGALFKIDRFTQGDLILYPTNATN